MPMTSTQRNARMRRLERRAAQLEELIATTADHERLMLAVRELETIDLELDTVEPATVAA